MPLSNITATSTNLLFLSPSGLSVHFRSTDPRSAFSFSLFPIFSAYLGLSAHFCSLDPRQLLIRLFLLITFAPSGLPEHFCSQDPRRLLNSDKVLCLLLMPNRQPPDLRFLLPHCEKWAPQLFIPLWCPFHI